MLGSIFLLLLGQQSMPHDINVRTNEFNNNNNGENDNKFGHE